MCGLFGFIGFKKQPIDIKSFIALGVENDTRGGHGCGIFCDGEIEYGPSSEKYFESFYEDSKLLPTIEAAEVLIGHDRKASIGGISDEKLQPVVSYDENGDIDFVLMHNGTITNHTELAKKYLSMEKEESDKFTDSQIMARIVYTHGFGVFSEYVGAGVFVIVDYRTPKRKPSVYVFKGKSKEHSYSKEAEEERPLYYIRTKNGLWFSSIMSYLRVMNYKQTDGVYTFPCNQVLLINHNANLQLIEKIDRSELVQKPSVVYTSGNSNSHWGKSKEANLYDSYDYGDYYDDYEGCGWYGYESQRPAVPGIYPIERTIDVGNSQTAQMFTNVQVNGQMEHTPLFRYIDSASKVPLTGVYYVNKFGQYVSQKDTQHPYELFLFNGVPIYGKEVLSTIVEYCGLQTECTNFDEMCQYFPELIYPFSQWPYYDFHDTRKYYRFSETGKQILYNGNLVVPFGKIDDLNFEFEEGELVGSKHQKKATSRFYKKYRIACMKNYDRILNYLTV